MSLLQVHVYPLEHEKAVAAVKATHTKEAGPEGGRKQRRKTMYTSRKSSEPAASVAAVVVGAVQP
jgi:large subunit ribosomal protein L27